LTKVTAPRKVKIPDGLLFFNVNLDLFEVSLADPIWSEPDLNLNGPMCWDDSLGGNIGKGRPRVSIEDAPSDLLKVEIDVKVAYIFNFHGLLH
jgi:hypothetical protein